MRPHRAPRFFCTGPHPKAPPWSVRRPVVPACPGDRCYKFPTHLTKQPYSSFTRFLGDFCPSAAASGCKRNLNRLRPTPIEKQTRRRWPLTEQETNHEEVTHNSRGDSV